MSPPTIRFEINVDGLEKACRNAEWAGGALIVVGVVGLVFGLFWVLFGAVCLIGQVGSLQNVLLLLGAGGMGPMIGAAVVIWVGVSRRIGASRLRELATLARARGAVSVARLAALLNDDQGAAETLLRRACELGVAVPLDVAPDSLAARPQRR